jgi:glycosyltransferase involved in cell wall biosynthesis
MSGTGEMQPIVFVDDAHTFGGAQIAMAWAIRTVLRHRPQPVVCVCPAATRDAILPIIGKDERLRFIDCKPALPLNILSFPVRLWSFHRLLAPLVGQGVRKWWFNLSGIEFCLAPLLALRWLGLRPVAWLHNSETFQFYNAKQPALNRMLSRLRDALANRFVFGLYTCIVTPSHATEESMKARFWGSNPPRSGFLYPAVGYQSEQRDFSFNKLEAAASEIDIWMINRVEYAQKNNLAGLTVLRLLKNRNIGAHLNVIGDGPDTIRFGSSIDEFGLAECVTFHGWRKDPWKMVPGDAVIFIPSFFESMSLVAREAMLYGVKMVLSPLPVFLEAMPGDLIAGEFSDESFADKIGEVHSMSRERILDIYKKALEKFSDETFVAKFESLLQAESEEVPTDARHVTGQEVL